MGWKCLFVRGSICLVSMARETEVDMQGWISNRFDLPMLKLHKRRERSIWAAFGPVELQDACS